jgi:arsenate reductase
VEDPAEVTGSDDEKRAAFRRALTILKRRIELLLALPIEKLDAIALQGKLTEIGRSGAGKSGR